MGGLSGGCRTPTTPCTACSRKPSANWRRKPFRLIVPRGGSHGCLYGYGPATAAGLQDAANTFADPQQLRALPPSVIDAKPMPSNGNRASGWV